MKTKGIKADMPSEFQKLADIIELNVFELIITKDECKAVYLMNDAVESFLVFENAKITGTYQSEDALQQVVIECLENAYIMIVKQGTGNVFTIKFDELVLSSFYYRYGDVGHFWVQGYEYLRQIEYQLAVIRDKYRFMGENSCNDKEKLLAKLADFPPIKAYPSVPAQYYVPMPDNIDAGAVEYLSSLAQKAGDMSMSRALRRYVKRPGFWYEKKITRMLHRTRHRKTVELLIQEMRAASEEYPERKFSEEEKMHNNRLHLKAEQAVEKAADSGMKAVIYREEPFEHEKDSITYKEHVMIWKNGLINNKVQIITFED